MSQENKGEDELQRSIQHDESRIRKLEADLDAARKKPTRDEASIKDLREELAELRARVDRHLAMKSGVGVGSSTRSKYCMAGCFYIAYLRRFSSRVILLTIAFFLLTWECFPLVLASL